MIPLNFYRDDNYVYYNNPNGITKKMSIADFESAMSGGGGGDLQISFTGDISEQSTIINISYNGIKNAVLSGKAVRLVQPYEGEGSAFYSVYTLITFENDDGSYYATFTCGSTDYTITSDDPDADMNGGG